MSYRMLQRSSFCRALHSHQPMRLDTAGLDGLSRYQIILNVLPKANQRAWQYSTIRSVPLRNRTNSSPSHFRNLLYRSRRSFQERKKKKKRKEKRSELRAGRRCSRRDSGEKKAHTLPTQFHSEHHITDFTTCTWQQSRPLAFSGPPAAWNRPGICQPEPPPLSLTLFFIFQIRVCGEGGLGWFEILLNTIPPPRFEREGRKELCLWNRIRCTVSARSLVLSRQYRVEKKGGYVMRDDRWDTTVEASRAT